MIDEGDDALGRALAEACGRFGLDRGRLHPLGGMTGRVFGVDDVVLRVGPRETIEHELLAADAASEVVPVPETLDSHLPTREGSWAAALIRRVEGTVASELTGMSSERSYARGLSCGRAQSALWTAEAPAGFPTLGSGRALLHLDLHPLNIILGPDDRVAAVIDWTNAAAGSPDDDRARTSSILRMDPHAVRLHDQPRWRAFVSGWTEGAGLDDTSVAARAWACRFMLDDLRHRHSDAELEHVRVELRALEELARVR